MTNAVVKVPFRDHEIVAVETEDGVYVPLKPICERLELDWKSQHRKVSGDQERWGVVMMTTPSAGGEQESVCIPLRLVAMWLATINAKKVRADVEPVIRAYQTEAAAVLDEHFRLKVAAEREAYLRLAQEHAATVAHLLAAKPLFQRIVTIYLRGLSMAYVSALIGRTQRDTGYLLAELDRMGIVTREDWNDDGRPSMPSLTRATRELDRGSVH